MASKVIMYHLCILHVVIQVCIDETLSLFIFLAL